MIEYVLVFVILLATAQLFYLLVKALDKQADRTIELVASPYP